MHEKKKVRQVVSIILSFFIAAAIFTGVAAIELQKSWMNRELLQQTGSSNGYSYQMIREAEEGIVKVLEKSALPSSVLERIWDEEALYRTFYQYSEEVLVEGKNRETDTENFRSELDKSIREFLLENKVTVTEVLEQEIAHTVGDAADVYERLMYPSFLNRFYQLAHSVERLCKVVMGLSIFLLVVCFAGLYRMYHYKHHALEYVASGFFAAILLNIPAIVIMGNIKWVELAGIGPECYRNLIREFLKRGVQTDCMMLAVEILLFLLLCAWIRERRKKD